MTVSFFVFGTEAKTSWKERAANVVNKVGNKRIILIIIPTGTTQSNTYLLGIYCVIGIMLKAPGGIEMTQLSPQAARNCINGRDSSKNRSVCRVYV